MAQLRDAKPIRVGLNSDDNPSQLIDGEYTDAINIRTASSDQEHGQGPAETLQGEIDILINPDTLITYYGFAIGGQFIYSGYETVIIGTQVWMKRNWDADYPGSKVYNNDEANRAIYGGLYSHDMAKASDFCPSGWHVPTYADAETLLTYLGGLMLAGGNLKEVGDSHWLDPNLGASDIAGFRALPGGKLDAIFDALGELGLIWLADDGAPLAPIALNASSIQPFSFSANWGIQDGATGYRLDVATDSAFTSMVSGYNNLDVGNVLTLPITGLSKVTNYFYRVRAYNEIGTSDNSNTITLQTTNTAIPIYGALYNWYAVNTGKLAPVGWHVPTHAEFQTLIATLGGSGIAGAHLKETGFVHWSDQNSGSDNTSGFTALGSGQRNEDGSFTGLLGWTSFHSSDNYAIITPIGLFLIDVSDGAGDIGGDSRNYGFPIRLIKNDSVNSGILTDYDSNTYNCITIGTQVWMASNLNVKHYNDGTLIPNITDDVVWAALTTGAMCWYNNNEEKSLPVTDDDMKYLQTTAINAGTTTPVTTALTSKPFGIMLLDVSAEPEVDITSLVGKSMQLVGGVWVIYIDSLVAFASVELRITY